MIASAKPGYRGEWRSGHEVVMFRGPSRCSHLNGLWSGGRRPHNRRFHRVQPHDVRFRSTHRRTLVCAALSFVASVSQVAGAQRVLGVGEDATVLPRGAMRITAFGGWTTYNELYGPGGKLEALGAPLSTDSLGATQLEFLRPLQTTIRSLAQQPGATISLGAARTDFSARIARSAIAFDVGLTSRIMLTGKLPYEHTISEVTFDVNPRNEPGTLANMGINPALGAGTAAAATNLKLVDSLLRVSRELSTRLGACGAGGADPVCSNQQAVQTLIQQARTFASGIATTYGTGADTARGAAFVPLIRSTLQTAIEGRISALNASFKTYIPTLAVWDKPAAALAPISAGGASTLLGETLGVAPIGLVERSHLGDVELGVKLLLLDSFGSGAASRASRAGGFRFAIGGLVRLGTGQAERPDDLFDVATGDGQTDIEANGTADFVLGKRFWASASARYGLQMSDEKPFRIPDVARNAFVAQYREQTVTRDLGDYIELEAAPRYVYNDYFSLSGYWLFRRKGEDKYAGTFTVTDLDSNSVSLDASILGIGTDATEQRIGGGLSYSTLRAFDRGRANIPLDIQLLHTQSISGSGYTPKRFTTQIQLRYYTRLFGAPLRARRPAATTR